MKKQKINIIEKNYKNKNNSIHALVVPSNVYNRNYTYILQKIN